MKYSSCAAVFAGSKKNMGQMRMDTCSFSDIEVLLNELAKFSIKIRDILVEVFSLQKKSSHEQNNEEILFQDILLELTAVTDFENNSELENYFVQIKKNLRPRLEDFAFTKKANQAKDTAKLFKILDGLVDFYTSLAKQRFYLQGLLAKSEDQVLFNSFAAGFAIINKLKNDFVILNYPAIHKKIDNLDCSLQQAINYLNQIGYGKINLGFRDYQNSSCIKLLTEALHDLPSTEMLNITIDNLEAARQKGDRPGIFALEHQLRMQVGEIEKITLEFAGLSNNILAQYSSMLKTINQEQTSLQHSLTDIECLYKELINIVLPDLRQQNYHNDEFEYNDRFKPLKQCAKKLAACCQAQDEGLFLFGAKGWNKAANKILLTVEDFTVKSQSSVTLKLYLDSLDNLSKIRHAILTYRNELSEIQTIYARLDAMILKANKVFFIICNALIDVQSILASHVNHHETSFEYIKQFIQSHKALMLIGSTGGAGTFFFVALASATNPILIPLLSVAGGSIGLGVSSGAALALEVIKNTSSTNLLGEKNLSLWRRVREKLYVASVPEAAEGLKIS